MKQAQFFKRGADFFVFPSVQTTAGLWMGVDPVVKLGSDSPHEAQGCAILQALAMSEVGVPHPLDWSVPTTSLFQLAGARSCNEFEKSAKSIVVELDNGNLRLTPSRSLGVGKGFEPLLESEEIRLPATASPQEIGAGLDEALKRCR
jgi:hypothetical protein